MVHREAASLAIGNIGTSSSEFQMNQDNRDNDEGNGEVWRHLWLTTDENDIVDHRVKHGEWLTLKAMAELRDTEQDS